MRILKNYRIVIVLLCFISTINAQQFLGYHSSNYAGITSVVVNPANIADNRYKIDITLGSVYFNLNNSYAGLKDGFIGGLLKGDSLFVENFLDERTDNKVVMNSFFNNVEASALSFMFNSGIHGFGLDIKVRSYLNIDHLSDNLSHAIIDEMIYPSIYGIPQNHDGFSVQVNAWAEYGIVYGRVIQEGEHFMKIGVKPKLLQGLSSAYLYSEKLDVTLTSDSTMSLSDSYVSYGHSNNFDDPNDFKVPFKFTGKPSVGLDLGFVYEWRPKSDEYLFEMDGKKDNIMKDENKYKAKVSFSILDVGRIKYKKGAISHDFNPQVNDWDYKDLSLNSIYDFDDTLINRFANLNNEEFFKVTLPTTFVLQGDYHIAGDFYLNATAFQALKFKKRNNKTHNYSTYSVTPRWDWKWAGIYLPMSYNEFDQVNVGAGAMLGPIIIGTQNLLPMFSQKTVTGLDFYFGLKVSALNNPPRDRDHDKVSDPLDKCIDTPGVWKFKGCPDTDEDGIVDSEDECPKIPGLVALKGCPDRDEDGVKDSADDCPDIAGVKEFNGCPDRDGDGIKDSEDDCPDEIGLVEFSGCPDRDGDKVIDKLDLCPDDFGPLEQKGCPDRDGDGLFDHEDNCIETPGPRENQGCPDKDKDGDGVVDRKDKCPTEAGPVNNEGCPLDDTDEDGVLDEVDECPETPGPIENNGCPVMEEEEEEILNTAFNNLEFESGKAIIKFASFEALNELGVLLVKKDTWKLRISGHTDDVGAAQNNLKLSKDRSEALKDYFIERGIISERIIVEYYGETKPIADNSTPEGRQTNRRVEMEVVFE